MRYGRGFFAVALLAVVVLATGADINSSVRIADGQVHEGDVSSLNGPIKIGNGATVGECSSVNGSITIGENSRVGDVDAVNGEVEIGAGTVVDGEVSTINGRISLDDGASAREVASINGRIRLTGADVNGDVKTMNGDVTLERSARVSGNVIISDRGKNSSPRKRALRIELEGGSVIEGDVINEDPSTDVELVLRDGSRVVGSTEHVKVIEE